jgi:hypothetical protein
VAEKKGKKRPTFDPSKPSGPSKALAVSLAARIVITAYLPTTQMRRAIMTARRQNKNRIAMKKLLAALVAALFVSSFALTALAADVVILKGDAMCTKCAMHETDKCGCAIKTADGIVYYAEQNGVAKDFHDNICHAPAKVIATGTVSDKDGRKVITLSKIELDKDAK